MGSKMVLNRQKSSTAVQSAGQTYEGEMIESIVEIFGPEAGPAAKTLVNLAVEKLVADTNIMVKADDTHLNEAADDSEIADNLDDKKDAVRNILMEIREISTPGYGLDYVKKIGFDGPTPTDPLAVCRLGAQVLENLKKVEAPEPKRRGITLDLGQFTSPLADEVSKLDSLLATVSGEKTQAVATMVNKHESMKLYDRTFSATANLVSTLLKVAGENELARRVRPSTRKPGQTVEVAKDGPEPRDEPAAEIL